MDMIYFHSNKDRIVFWILSAALLFSSLISAHLISSMYDGFEAISPSSSSSAPSIPTATTDTFFLNESFRIETSDILYCTNRF